MEFLPIKKHPPFAYAGVDRQAREEREKTSKVTRAGNRITEISLSKPAAAEYLSLENRKNEMIFWTYASRGAGDVGSCVIRENPIAPILRTCLNIQSEFRPEEDQNCGFES